jgi:hypothetical protein
MRTLIVTAIVSVLLAVFTGIAPAKNPGTQGQPSQSCEVTTTTPGQASSAPGSAFNPDGVSGGVYADGQHSNPKAVSQYDVACFQLTP